MDRKSRTETIENFVAWNEMMARKYDPEAYHLRSNLAIRLLERKRVHIIKRMMAASPDDWILEVGCGAGNVLEAMERGPLFGIDLSELMLEKAQRRLRSRQTVLVRANVEHLPLAPRSVPKIICTEVLEHVQRPDAVLDEMQRVARPKAVVVISIPNEPLINRLKGVFFSLRLDRLLFRQEYRPPSHMEEEWHLHVLHLGRLRSMLDGKFAIQEVQAVPFRLCPLRYVVKCTPLPEKIQ